VRLLTFGHGDDVEVVHLLHDGRQTDHAPTDGVRLDGDRLVYDAGVPPTLFT
jgi:hypothetical protein